MTTPSNRWAAPCAPRPSCGADERGVSSRASAARRQSAAILRLREHGYLNDAAFAETYARLRQENEKLGQRRVRQDLQQKGVGTTP